MPSAPPFFAAKLLPEPPRGEVSNLLRRYVEVRLKFYVAGNDQKMLSGVKNEDGTVAASTVGAGC